MRQYGKILDRTIFDPNDFIINGDTVEIVIYNSEHIESGRAIVNLKHYNIVTKYKWGYSNDYVATKVANKRIYLHRLITEATEDEVVDHINHNKLDNRDGNLRRCTNQQNQWNSKMSLNNTSGVIGVTWNKRDKRWVAQMTYNGKGVCIGGYVSKDDAIAARKKAEEEYFGDFRYKGDAI